MVTRAGVLDAYAACCVHLGPSDGAPGARQAAATAWALLSLDEMQLNSAATKAMVSR